MTAEYPIKIKWNGKAEKMDWYFQIIQGIYVMIDLKQAKVGITAEE